MEEELAETHAFWANISVRIPIDSSSNQPDGMRFFQQFPLLNFFFNLN